MTRTTRGILWMIGAQLLFVAVWCAIKHLGQRLPLFEIVFFRTALSLLFLAPLTYARVGTLRGSNWAMLFWRSASGFIAMALCFYAMIHARIGNASTLFNTMPIFVAILAPWLLKEPFLRKRFALVALSFVGIVCIFKPDADIFRDVSLLALLSGAFAAHAMICIRKLHATDSSFTIAFYFTLISAIASLPLALWGYVPPTPAEWGWLLFIGFVVSFAQIFLTRSYRLGAATAVSPFSYTAVIGSYAGGILFFDEIPDPWAIAGTAIIIACGIGIMLVKPTCIEKAEESC